MKKRLLFILCLCLSAANHASAQTKTVTNKDLEKFRQKRLENEREYRENYARLGLPSPEELEKQNAESRRKLSELSQKIEAENAIVQNSFAARASDLRTRIVSVEAQINYLRGELNRFPRQNTFVSYAVYLPQTGSVYQPQIAAPLPPRAVLNRNGGFENNGARTYLRGAHNGISVSISGGYARRNGYYSARGYGFPIYYGGYVAPYFSDVNRSYERDELVSQIRSLEAARAGLYAERAVLEDEARRAGVSIE